MRTRLPRFPSRILHSLMITNTSAGADEDRPFSCGRVGHQPLTVHVIFAPTGLTRSPEEPEQSDDGVATEPLTVLRCPATLEGVWSLLEEGHAPAA